jgi:hypothetical protein
MVRTANRNVRTAHLPDRKIVASGRLAKIREISELLFRHRNSCPSRTPKSAVWTRVPETPILTRIRDSKAYK